MSGVFKIYGPLVLLVVAGFAAALYFVRPAPPASIRMATGAPGGAYAAFGRQYKEAFAAEGIEIELVESAGSLENLNLLANTHAQVDVAFIQGGMGVEAEYPNLVSLASLFPEPIWLFVRTDKTPSSALGLKGLRVAIGAQGSGTNALSTELLSAVGLGRETIEQFDIGGEAAVSALLEGDVDAAAFVMSERSEIIQKLLAAQGVDVTTFWRAEALSRWYRFLSIETLPEGAADLKSNIPPQTVTLLATNANLVARDDLHPAIATLLLRTAHRIHERGGLFAEPGEYPSTRYIDFPLSTEAERYFEYGPGFLQRYLPFWAADLAHRSMIFAIPFITLLLPLLRFAPPIYQWQARRRIYKWYQNVRSAEAAARADTSDDGRDRALALLDRIQAEVGTLQVPLSHSDELYHLRLHIQFVRRSIENGELQAQAPPTRTQ